MSVISLKNVSKAYKKSNLISSALNSINLELEEGKMYAIVGPSGCGKTTLLNIIAGLDTATSGEYFYNSKNFSTLNEKERSEFRNKNLGFVHQFFYLLDDYTALENVEMTLHYRNKKVSRREKLSRSFIRQTAKEYMEKLDLKEHMHKYPSELSGGQQQRVAIARAIVGNPELILADEPTGALDEKMSIEIIKILRNINKEGKTILIVTHNLELANYCDEIIKIKDGQIVS